MAESKHDISELGAFIAFLIGLGGAWYGYTVNGYGGAILGFFLVLFLTLFAFELITSALAHVTIGVMIAVIFWVGIVGAAIKLR